MEIFLEYIDKVGLIGIIVAVTAFLVGMKFPDWDFKMKLQHRSILTHSPLFLFCVFKTNFLFYNNIIALLKHITSLQILFNHTYIQIL